MFDSLSRQFGRMGARAHFRANTSGVVLDVRRDVTGEYFDVGVASQVALQAVDTQPRDRHLLLLAREPNGTKSKFLCGHDERHWFVAAVPGLSVSNVATALDALKPQRVRFLENQRRMRRKHRNRRRNEVFVRQGEWFFVPAPDARLSGAVILRNEPLRRGAGKPHMCAQLVRTGGEQVYVSPWHPRGLTSQQYEQLLVRDPKSRNLSWQSMRRNPQVFVRGTVRHSDHKTIVLRGWHRVLMNTEHEAPQQRSVVFLD